MKRKEIKSITIKQDNDASCFNGHCNDQNGSQHNKRAKRLSSKRLRALVKNTIKEQVETETNYSFI
jgi:hypothetical protein